MFCTTSETGRSSHWLAEIIKFTIFISGGFKVKHDLKDAVF